jgi:hypothetical protein
VTIASAASRLAMVRNDEGEGQPGLAVRGLDHLFPDHGVGALARGAVHRAVAGVGQRRVDRLDGDAAVALDPERLQLLDELVHRLPGDVALHEVAPGTAHHRGEVDQVRDADVVAQQLDDRVGAVCRSGDAQV